MMMWSSYHKLVMSLVRAGFGFLGSSEVRPDLPVERFRFSPVASEKLNLWLERPLDSLVPAGFEKYAIEACGCVLGD